MNTENLHKTNLLIKENLEVDHLLFIKVAFKYDWNEKLGGVVKWLDVVILNNCKDIVSDIYFTEIFGVHPFAGAVKFFKSNSIKLSDGLKPLETTVFSFNLYLDFINIQLIVIYTINKKKYTKKIYIQEFPDFDDWESHGVYNLIDYNKNNNIGKTLEQIGLYSALETIKNDPDIIKSVSPYQFEKLTAELFRKNNYEVKHIGRSGDNGVDIIAIQNTKISSMKFLIQCKHTKNKVGVSVIRELFGCKTDLKATKAILVTSSSFTKGAIDFVNRNVWELDLLDFEKFKSFI